MFELVLATANPYKVDELRAIFASSSESQAVRVIGLSDLPADVRDRLYEPDEHGSTFEENAAIKAVSYAEQTGRLCLADDSGLEVDALHGRPGVISSHYFNDGRETEPPTPRAERDRLNNERLLRDLHGVPDPQRTARFVCVMALAAPASHPLNLSAKPGLIFSARGTFEGRIGTPPQVPRGEHGFGYDPLFLAAPDYTRTSAELSPHEKNVLSHRGQATRQLAQQLRGLNLR